MGLIADQLHPVLIEDFQILRKELDSDRLGGTRWLITGATGLIPAYLVRFLCWLNEVESLDLQLDLWVRSGARAAALFPWLSDTAELIRINEARWDKPEDWDVSPATFIVHAASPATPAECRADPEGVKACNIAATTALLDRVSLPELKGFLFFSSSEVYGDTGDVAYPAEDQIGRLDPDAPRSLYPLAKRKGEELCRNAFLIRGLPTRIARIFHTYGPGMNLTGDDRVFADLVGNAVRGEDIVLKSDGSARRAFCYLSDTTSALLKILIEGGDGESYNVGNPQGILSVSELANLLIRLVPGKGLKMQILNKAGPQSASGAVFPEIAKLRNLGWQPRLSPQDGFARTMEYYNS